MVPTVLKLDPRTLQSFCLELVLICTFTCKVEIEDHAPPLSVAAVN